VSAKLVFDSKCNFLNVMSFHSGGKPQEIIKKCEYYNVTRDDLIKECATFLHISTQLSLREEDCMFVKLHGNEKGYSGLLELKLM
jgi:hypothetical protein